MPYDGLLTFVVSPDGERIAFQVIEEGSALPLSVIDVGSGEIEEVTDAASATYFWSPEGERLLYLTPEPDEELSGTAGACGTGRRRGSRRGSSPACGSRASTSPTSSSTRRA